MDVVIGSAYRGPADSANGGYACGVFSTLSPSATGAPAAVVLHAPPPLASALDVRGHGARAQVWHGDVLVATVGPGSSTMRAVDPVTVEEARRAESSFAGREGHPFPTCFVCGVDVEPALGFPLTPGRLDGRDLVACTWTPDADVSTELVWSALDCPGGWTCDPVREPMVLGRMSALVLELPEPGRPHVVVGGLWRRNGRTAHIGTALYDPAGRLLAKATSVWIALEAGRQAPPERRGMADVHHTR
ncbi:hypothetical protein [Umezawaea sp. Da 62-37]|uniref:hypothetical protein n=1 Tax=Umezawaea sp. Da 62-37 TaxID=3075927 RepID=UPI0028F73964|nr:hypothetical protein [Umezawaea sp. Da 62-37]WNV84702.1 hypothetical protein RM788_42135 [Umezawaea sp. Da 62-37]